MSRPDAILAALVDMALSHGRLELLAKAAELPASAAAIGTAAIHMVEELGLTDMLKDWLRLGLAHLHPDDLDHLTEAAKTTWRVQTVPRPPGE